ncbi:hypothetical protein [Microvirga splendida]|uniref:DUF3618 domain-containing protein n=1 Tax=Microvirga splendida TaxID=2795727 RepID=A0ABS0Y856_9HYPH|nr:hypothetical protein [Microvirga splendida]
MTNPPDVVGSQSTPDRQEGKPTGRPSDNSLAENSQQNLDARLDHAIEETFPTSDPVSVTITKAPEPDQDATPATGDDQQSHAGQESTEEVLDQVREALQDVVDQASGAAGDIYSRGEHYARRVGERYPQAQQYVREGQRLVTQHTTANPLLSLLAAGAIGYVLGWLIHGERRDRKPNVPDYGRTSRGYAPHRDEQRR